jgi:hypothetical protein
MFGSRQRERLNARRLYLLAVLDGVNPLTGLVCGRPTADGRAERERRDERERDPQLINHLRLPLKKTDVGC